ncbi:hypothetical protein BX661DRAFT_168206 [Kickxella alabastrina]|uniref:uncharacterized protein n=1 Tax=Kickxella alabastrina TaxID=61397 RepID=UPI0022202FB4|nr:uncharacterized protein BX661DRAFT_168206 [Kickxella alabastrina]KAI7835031.1 hypothetical protein BX661DRAFT_168206 [Kickxella alabastrina]
MSANVEALTAKVAELETVARHQCKGLGTADTADYLMSQYADKETATFKDETVQLDAQPAAVETSCLDAADNSSDTCMTDVSEVVPVPAFMEWSQSVAGSESYVIVMQSSGVMTTSIRVAVVNFKEDKAIINLCLVISCVPASQDPGITMVYGIEYSTLDDSDDWAFKNTTT